MPLKDRISFHAEPLYLMDGNAFLYRGFYAFPDLSRSDGFQTNAMYIVLRLVLKILREEKPAYFAFMLDGKGKTFRHEMYEDYKAQRQKAPESLTAQVGPLVRGLELMGLNVTVSEGVEADDLICSLAACHHDTRPVVILGPDKDFNQCLTENVFLWDPSGKTEKLTSLADFREQWPMSPEHWADYQALIGDSSDNIPGVPGVGPKTAHKIMDQFPTLEELKAGYDDLSPALKKKLGEHMDKVFLYRELTRLKRDLCDDVDIDDLRTRPPDAKAVAAFLQEYEFRSLAREFAQMGLSAGPTAAEGGNGEQMSLFGEQGEVPAVEPRVATAADELAVEGVPVGLTSQGTAYRLGLGEDEWAFSGPPEKLADRLSRASTVFVPSLKEWLAADPTWKAVPLERWCDVSLAGYLLNPEERDYSVKRLAAAYAEDPELAASAHLACEAHGLAVLDLGQAMCRKVEAAGLGELMRTVEIPLIPVLADMERAGIGIDLEAFSAFLNDVSRRLDELTAEIHELGGAGEFNIRSSQQLAAVLFDTLGLPTKGKTPGGAPSTSSTVLERLRAEHDIIERILEYRMLDKLKSTYLEPLPQLVDESGRLHTTFNQLATATGRLSSSSPNLQNIPIRGEFGPRMRRCFAAGEGSLLVAADYSQIELRILAHLSQDPTLLEAFRSGADIHAATAGLIFDKSPADVAKDERRGAKTINFGLLYGMGPRKLADELGVPLKEAKAFIARYFEKLTKLKAFYDEILESARTHGYVTTLAGRRRLLRDINSRNANLRSQAERQAINTRVQGSAADIIKMAMVQAHGDGELDRLGARLILQVHDELVMEAPPKTARDAAERLASIMSSVYELDVPLVVDRGVGSTWEEAH
jgi:DNA polymerase-1